MVIPEFFAYIYWGYVIKPQFLNWLIVVEVAVRGLAVWGKELDKGLFPCAGGDLGDCT